MKKIKRRGLMLVVSSPSGAGKTTLCNLLRKIDKHIHPSISYTTRVARDGEVDGKDYYFTDEANFQRMVEGGHFVEHAQVFGNRYGTPKKLVEDYLKNGEDVIFDIDWQGNNSLTKIARDDVVSIFLLPPNKIELLKRLKSRAQDNHETIEYRLQCANADIEHWHEYDYTIINRDLDESLRKMLSILRAERLKKARRLGVPEFVKKLIEEKVDVKLLQDNASQ